MTGWVPPILEERSRLSVLMNYLHALRSVPSSTLLLGPVSADRCTLLLPSKLARIRLILVVLLDGESAQLPLLLVFDALQKQAFGLMDGFEGEADTRILELERAVLHSLDEPLADWERFGNLVYASSARDETPLVRLHLLFEGLDVMSVLAPPRPLTEIVLAEARSRAPIHAEMEVKRGLPSDFIVRFERDDPPSNVRIKGRTDRWLLEVERAPVMEVPSSQPEQPDWGAMLTQSRLAALQDAVGMHEDAGPPSPPAPTRTPAQPTQPTRLIHVPDATRESMKEARSRALRAKRQEKLDVFREEVLHMKRVGKHRTEIEDDDPRLMSAWERLTPAGRAQIMHVHPNDVRKWNLVEVDSEPFGRHFESLPTHFALPDGSIQELPDLPPRFGKRFGPGIVVARLAPCSLVDPTAEPPLRAEDLGRGIFAVATLPSGYRFGYQGVVFPAKLFEDSIQNKGGSHGSDGSRCIEILGDMDERVKERHRYHLDSKWHPQCIGAFANHMPGHLNARITVLTGFPGAIKTTRRIQPGEEIFVSYGGDYGLPDAGLMTPVERDAWRGSHPSVPRAPQYDWQTVPGFEGAMTLSEFLAMATCKEANREVHAWRRKHLRVSEEVVDDADVPEEKEIDGEYRPGRSKQRKKGKGGTKGRKSV